MLHCEEVQFDNLVVYQNIIIKIMTLKLILPILLLSGFSFGQNPMAIPPAINNANINLTLQTGVTQFYPGVTTNTMGANGSSSWTHSDNESGG